MSGVDLDGTQIRKGAADAVKRVRRRRTAAGCPAELDDAVAAIAESGGTPLVVARDNCALGVVHLKDIVKGGMNERFDELRRMGIRTVMITGDNPVTAAVIAQEAGVDDFLAEATPEAKMQLIRDEQAKGRLVAMTGDGTNDAPALAQADVGVAMNTGHAAAKEAGNMVDLDSNPTKLIEIVEVGKQLLITRGALTTFSIANDVAKYFAIIPAIFAATYAVAGERGPARRPQRHGPRHARRARSSRRSSSTRWSSPRSCRSRCAACSYRAIGATALLRRNLLIYGLGGVIVPFIGIKLIDLARPQRLRRVALRSGVRGRYRILLGMAAGVGKTYRMLQEGRQAQAEGRRRRDRLPRAARPARDRRARRGARGRAAPARRARRRSSSRRWTSTPSSGARPQLALVDELAHTNAPGSRNAKRYEDIDEILDAGHRRHLDGQRPAPREPQRPRLRAHRRPRPRDLPRPRARRGRRGRARRPDAGGAAAAPAGRQGLPRRPGRARRCTNFFRHENLAALRELALREVAEDVEARRHPAVLDPTGERPLAERDPRARHAAAALAAAAAPRLALGAAARAPSSTSLWVRRPGQRARPRQSRTRSPTCGASASCSAPTSSRRRATTSSRRCAAWPPTAASTYVFIGTPDEPPARGDHCAARCVMRLVRALPGIDIRIVADPAERRTARER